MKTRAPLPLPRTGLRAATATVGSFAVHGALVVGMMRAGDVPVAEPPPVAVEVEFVELATPATAPMTRELDEPDADEPAPTPRERRRASEVSRPARRARGPSGRLSLGPTGDDASPFGFGRRLTLGDLTPRIERVDPGRFVRAPATTTATTADDGGVASAADGAMPEPDLAVAEPAGESVATDANAASAAAPDVAPAPPFRARAVLVRTDLAVLRRAVSEDSERTFLLEPTRALDVSWLGLEAEELVTLVVRTDERATTRALATRLGSSDLEARIVGAANARGQTVVFTTSGDDRVAIIELGDARRQITLRAGAVAFEGETEAARHRALGAALTTRRAGALTREVELDEPRGTLTVSMTDPATPGTLTVSLTLDAGVGDTLASSSIAELATAALGLAAGALTLEGEQTFAGATASAALRSTLTPEALVAAFVATPR